MDKRDGVGCEMDKKPCVRRHPDITNDTNSLAQQYPKVKQNHRIFENSGIVRKFTCPVNFWQGEKPLNSVGM
jgi:hypothetical protein